MTDYSELVKALLTASTVSTAWGKLMQDAATAIEELSKTVKGLTTKVERSPMQIIEKAFDRAIEAWNRRANDDND